VPTELSALAGTSAGVAELVRDADEHARRAARRGASVPPAGSPK
jgi:hypothetical protein